MMKRVDLIVNPMELVNCIRALKLRAVRRKQEWSKLAVTPTNVCKERILTNEFQRVCSRAYYIVAQRKITHHGDEK